MLVKQGLVGVRNGCIVTRGNLETIRLQLAGVVLNALVVSLGLVQFKESSRSLWYRDVSDTRSSNAS